MPGIMTLPRITGRQNTELDRPALPLDPAVRAAGAIGLLTVGLIHVLEIQGQLSGAVWLTVGFCLLAVAAPMAGLWLLARPSLASWLFCLLVNVAAAGGYILTRSVAVPGDKGDAGNWLEPLGVAALFTEVVVAILALLVLASIRGRHQQKTS